MNRESLILTISIFIAGLCSIIYELLIGTTSSYFLGDSVKQFSLTIGLYMASMGLGSYISRFISKNLLSSFIFLEILLGLIGGISVPALYMAFAFTDYYQLFMFVFILLIGTLIGLEVPLLTRLMQKYHTLKINISNILTLDYLGALLATLLFPFFLIPFLGIFKSSLFFGIINMSIGFLNLWAFSPVLKLSQKRVYLLASTFVTLFLIFIIYSSQFLLKTWEKNVYEDRVVFSKRSNYQNIVLTKNKDDIRLFLDGNLQFSSIDEYRYHESLVHLPFSFAKNPKRILVLGGGDGLAVREILKYKNVEEIILVDLDRAVVEMALRNPHLLKLNKGSLNNPKVKVLNQDAFIFLKNNRQKFDIIISDLPDPNNISLARLYSLQFYRFINKNLNADGLFLTQATSPFHAKKTFWCINRTILKSGQLFTYPFHLHVPSFSEWGFIMASSRPLEIARPNYLAVKTKFLSKHIISNLFIFPKDLKDNLITVSTLEDPKVLSYYLNEWKYWN